MEIVYILTNPAMPGYVKIGKTGGAVEERVRGLSNTTSIPLPFECYYAASVANMNEVEKALHDAFGDHRINPRREFFNIAPERIVAVLRLLALQEVTPSRDVAVDSEEDAVAIQQARKKRSAFNFKMVDIPAGATLAFIRDESITCVVAEDQKHVIFKGEQTSLSTAAQVILGYRWQVQGPAYWTYNGEILDELRLRLEEEEADQQYSDNQFAAVAEEWRRIQ